MASHVVSKRTTAIIFTLLMLLLALAISTGETDLGAWNLPLALSISAAKTVLIVLYFMHVVFSSSLVRILAVCGLLWLAIMFTLAFSDYATRGWLTEASNRSGATAAGSTLGKIPTSWR